MVIIFKNEMQIHERLNKTKSLVELGLPWVLYPKGAISHFNELHLMCYPLYIQTVLQLPIGFSQDIKILCWFSCSYCQSIQLVLWTLYAVLAIGH